LAVHDGDFWNYQTVSEGLFSEVGFSSGNRALDIGYPGEDTAAGGGGKRMATIAKDNDVVTLINVLTVAQEDQQRLVDVLVQT
jgi:hypothetical protein